MTELKVSRDDVARLAGVSVATVSNVLNDKPGFSCAEKTRQKVRDAAEKLGYVPSFAAGSLASGKTNIIGLLIPSQAQQFSSQFYSRTISGLTMASDASEYYLLYLGQDRPEKYIQCLRKKLPEGMFVFQTIPDERHVTECLKAEKPVVTINYISSQSCPSVTMDYEDGMKKAFGHLAGQECAKIGFVTFLMENQAISRYRDAYDVMAREHDRIECRTVLLRPDHVEEDLAQVPGFGLDGLIIDEWWVCRILMRTGGGYTLPRSAVFCDEKVEETVPENITLFPTRPEEVGQAAWDVMQKLLAGENVSTDQIKIPF